MAVPAYCIVDVCSRGFVPSPFGRGSRSSTCDPLWSYPFISQDRSIRCKYKGRKCTAFHSVPNQFIAPVLKTLRRTPHQLQDATRVSVVSLLFSHDRFSRSVHVKPPLYPADRPERWRHSLAPSPIRFTSKPSLTYSVRLFMVELFAAGFLAQSPSKSRSA